MARTVTTPAQLAADLRGLAEGLADRAHKAVVTGGALLQSAVKRNAAEPRTNERPSTSPEGPRLLTGHYNRSISRLTTRSASGSRTQVGTNAPQALRLEVGFQGVDAAGRTVDQRAYPHFGPGFDEVAPVFQELVTEAVRPDD